MSFKQSSSPVIHSVHFYQRDEALIEGLINIIESAINAGNAILVVSTEEHSRLLTSALEKRLGDLRELKKRGRLNLYDAQATLDKFMAKGLPDRQRFLDSVGELIATLKHAAWNAQRGLTVFGEMVAVPLGRGEFKGRSGARGALERSTE